MALPSAWDSQDAVPDWAKADVVEREGKYVLDVAGYEPKAKVDEFRTNNTQLRKTIEELQAKLTGALSADEAAKLHRELETARERLDAGEDDKRVQELVEKRLTPMKIGEREIRVSRTDKPALEQLLKNVSERENLLSTRTQTLESELGKERIVGGAFAAMAAIGGFREGAKDDVVLHISNAFRLGEDHQPYLPDPEDKDGKTPRVGADGKPVTIAGYLRDIQSSGRKAGVWFEDAKGPGLRRVVSGSAADKPVTSKGVDRISRGLAAQQNSK